MPSRQKCATFRNTRGYQEGKSIVKLQWRAKHLYIGTWPKGIEPKPHIGHHASIEKKKIIKITAGKLIFVYVPVSLFLLSPTFRFPFLLHPPSQTKRGREKKSTTHTFFNVGGNNNKPGEQSNAHQTYSTVNTIVQFLRLTIKRNFHLKLLREFANDEIEKSFHAIYKVI